MKQLIFVCIFVCLARLSTGVAIKRDTLSSSSSSFQLEKNDKEPNPRCVPGTTWKRDCNICRCTSAGLPLCTLIECQVATAIKRDTLSSSSSSFQLEKNEKDTQGPELLQGKECAPGSTWKGLCDNQCSCSSKGYGLCTEIGCLEQQTEPNPRCAPGTTWKRDCNICQCRSPGFPICTLIECQVPTGVINDSATDRPFYKEALPSETNSKNNKGRLKKKHNQVTFHKMKKRSLCKPKQSFFIDCNSCNCSANGQSYTCTHQECMDSTLDKEVEVFKENEEGSRVEQHSVCKPRATFYIGCNTCHCNHNGTDYNCTDRPCDLPKDVEVFHELKETKPDMQYESQ